MIQLAIILAVIIAIVAIKLYRNRSLNTWRRNLQRGQEVTYWHNGITCNGAYLYQVSDKAVMICPQTWPHEKPVTVDIEHVYKP